MFLDFKMAGFSRIFCIGGTGGFQGADGINPINLQILVGDGNRQWLESHYFGENFGPLGNIRKIIPEGPNHPNSLIDACIAFFPSVFNKCPSIQEVREELKNVNYLDFDLEKDKIPKKWNELRQEALPHFEKLNIFKADLIELNVNEKHLV